MKKLVIVLLALVTVACASLSKEECLVADWYIIGLEDGSAGKSLDTIGQHRQACARVGVTPNMAEYQRGHQRGLRDYCTIDNGFELGQGGGRYHNLCPEDLEGGFLTGFNEGRLRYEARQRVLALERELEREEKALHSLLDDLQFHENALVSGDGTREDRQSHLAIIKALNDEQPSLERHIDRLVTELEHERHALSKLIAEQARQGYY